MPLADDDAFMCCVGNGKGRLDSSVAQLVLHTPLPWLKTRSPQETNLGSRLGGNVDASVAGYTVDDENVRSL